MTSLTLKGQDLQLLHVDDLAAWESCVEEFTITDSVLVTQICLESNISKTAGDAIFSNNR